MKLFFESLSTCFRLHVCSLQGLNCFWALRFCGGNAYFQQLLISWVSELLFLMKLFFESLSTCFSLHVCFLQDLSCFWALRFRGGNAYFQQLLIHSRLTGYYFRVIKSYCIQYGRFVLSGMLVLWWFRQFCVRSSCAARDTHFSAFIRVCVCVCTINS